MLLFSHSVMSNSFVTPCLPGSSVHGVPQARILEWVAISSSRGSFWPRDGTCISWMQADSLPPSHQGILDVFTRGIFTCLSVVCWKDYPFFDEVPWYLCQRSADYKYLDLIWRHSVLFCWSLCLPLWQYYISLITVVLWEALKWDHVSSQLCSSFPNFFKFHWFFPDQRRFIFTLFWAFPLYTYLCVCTYG